MHAKGGYIQRILRPWPFDQVRKASPIPSLSLLHPPFCLLSFSTCCRGFGPEWFELTVRSDHHLRPRQCRNGGIPTSLQSWSTDQRSRCRQSTRPHDRRTTNQRLWPSRSTIPCQSSRAPSQRPLDPLPCVRSRRIPPPSHFTGRPVAGMARIRQRRGSVPEKGKGEKRGKRGYGELCQGLREVL